jgi:hypothetical protein
MPRKTWLQRQRLLYEKVRKYTDAAGGKTSASGAGAKRRQQASSYRPKCPGCGIFDHVCKDCFYRSHHYFNKDPSIVYAQSSVGIRYYNTFGGRYIKERDMDPTMQKKDRGASMQRKRSWLDDFVRLSGKSLGSERLVSRSRDPSLHSRGDSSVRVDTSVFIPAHQRDRRIGESNSDSRRKEFYDQRREAVSSRDHGHDYAKDRDRGKDYGKDRDQDRYKGAARDQRSSGRDPTPDRRSHSREKVDDHKKRAGDWRDKKDGQETRDNRRDSSPHPAWDRSGNCECTHIDDDYSNACAFLDAAPVANEAVRADDRFLSASIRHPSRNPRIPRLHVDVLPDTGAWSTDDINEATAAWLRSVGIKRKDCSITVCSGIGTPQQFCVPCRGSYTFDLIIYNDLLVGVETISITANEIPSTYAVLLGHKPLRKIIYP